MRLLRYHFVGNGWSYELQDFQGQQTPPYAILSHTWGPDDDEVSYQDVKNGTGLGKAGWSKIEFCIARANEENIQWIWVDTCCIDKSSAVELSEAINSMFRWYHNSAICYAYLEGSFEYSRWWTRGWTLQELLAPRRVEFYSDLVHCGSKQELGDYIQSHFGIPTSALCNAPLSGFSVEDRLSWAQNRQTKREEDAAYSMLGIFNVSMPIIYGEGRTKAYNRLFEAIDHEARNRQLDSRYSKYLPSAEQPDLQTELASRERPIGDPQVSIPAFSSQRDSLREGVAWDASHQRWLQTCWSDRYQRHYRNHYVQESGWAFLDWCDGS
ncbi:hypothetical protein ACN47E_006090 [Coniothyrium glycines]